MRGMNSRQLTGRTESQADADEDADHRADRTADDHAESRGPGDDGKPLGEVGKEHAGDASAVGLIRQAKLQSWYRLALRGVLAAQAGLV